MLTGELKDSETHLTGTSFLAQGSDEIAFIQVDTVLASLDSRGYVSVFAVA